MKRLIILICFSSALFASTAHSDNLLDKLKRAAEKDSQQSSEVSDATRFAGDAQALVLTIDGVDPTLLPGSKLITGLFAAGRGDSYLVDPITKNWGFATDVRHYSWSGDLSKTDTDIQSLKTQIPLLVEIAKRRGQPFVIVAHSWGSVLAYRAISELKAEGKIDDESIRKLVTIGSPIDPQGVSGGPKSVLAKQQSDKYVNWVGAKGVLGPAESWTNFWIGRDNISGPIDEVEHNVELKYSFADPHNAYWKVTSLLNRIGEVVAVDLASFSPTNAADPDTTVSQTDPVSTLSNQPADLPQDNTGQVNASPTAVYSEGFRTDSIPFDSAHFRNLEEALRAGVEDVNCKGCILGGAKMSNLELTSIDFSGAIMPCADFSGSNFHKANDQTEQFSSTETKGKFDGAYLVKANFSNAQLSGAGLGSMLMGARFDQANLAGAGLRRANLMGASFANADLSGASLEGAVLLTANFSGANLEGASLKDAFATVNDLSGARLCNTTMPDGSVEYSGCSGNSSARTSTVEVRQFAPTWNGLTLSKTNYQACGTTQSGSEIVDVDWGGPAWALGLSRGDIIQHVERPIDTYLATCESHNYDSPEKQAACREDTLKRTDRYKKPGCDAMYFFKGTRLNTTYEAPLKSSSMRGDIADGEQLELFVLRDNRVSILPMTVGTPALLQASIAVCPTFVATLNKGRDVSSGPESTGTYRGAALASIVHRGKPAMRVLSVEPGSEFDEAGVKVGDVAAVLQPQHIRYGDINTADKLRLMEQDHYNRNPNNPHAPFPVLIWRDKQSFWIDLPPRTIPN